MSGPVVVVHHPPAVFPYDGKKGGKGQQYDREANDGESGKFAERATPAAMRAGAFRVSGAFMHFRVADLRRVGRSAIHGAKFSGK
jgi:hypothetical protein